MIEITELDELLNTLATSALEPHGEYEMNFSNREQKLIYEYIKLLQQKNQQLREVTDEAINEINLVIELIKQQPTNDDSWILERLNSFKIVLKRR